MIHFPANPVTGQQYVATNGVTYTWLTDRWNSTDAIEKQKVEYYIEGGDAAFFYAENRDGLLDGGTA
jgi:hypothetical protein